MIYITNFTASLDARVCGSRVCSPEGLGKDLLFEGAPATHLVAAALADGHHHQHGELGIGQHRDLLEETTLNLFLCPSQSSESSIRSKLMGKEFHLIVKEPELIALDCHATNFDGTGSRVCSPEGLGKDLLLEGAPPTHLVAAALADGHHHQHGELGIGQHRDLLKGTALNLFFVHLNS